MVAILPYYILGSDSDINGCDSVLAYYILGSNGDINGCDTCLLYSWQSQRFQWLRYLLAIFLAVTAILMVAIRYLLTIFLAVTAISMLAILPYYILGSDSDINGCETYFLYSWQ